MKRDTKLLEKTKFSEKLIYVIHFYDSESGKNQTWLQSYWPNFTKYAKKNAAKNNVLGGFPLPGDREHGLLKGGGGQRLNCIESIFETHNHKNSCNGDYLRG
jgi:hypothetical protein